MRRNRSRAGRLVLLEDCLRGASALELIDQLDAVGHGHLRFDAGAAINLHSFISHEDLGCLAIELSSCLVALHPIELDIGMVAALDNFLELPARLTGFLSAMGLVVPFELMLLRSRARVRRSQDLNGRAYDWVVGLHWQNGGRAN